jgi:hypothetical protein
MNRSDFLNMIESRSPVDRHMLGEVVELINIFPYFQSAHLLLLKGLQDNNDVKFENQLKSSAIHIANRELLYHYLRHEPLAVKPAADPTPVQEEEHADNETHFSVLEEEHADNETNFSVLEGEPSSDILIVEPIRDKVSAHAGDEVSAPAGDDDLLELIDDDEVADEFVVDAHESKPAHDTKITRKQLQSDLIDKFIITNPRIEPSREKTDMPAVDLSRPSTEENGVFVTDTLAQIYVHQGYYSKAIDIYEKLSLKFPEKSSYFATQIEKVKEYLKK